MSQVTVASRKNIERTNWTEITPQALYDKCLSLATNLWWSWHPEVVNLFRDLDPIKWRKIDHNPIMLLSEMTPDQLAERAAEMVLYTRIKGTILERMLDPDPLLRYDGPDARRVILAVVRTVVPDAVAS